MIQKVYTDRIINSKISTKYLIIMFDFIYEVWTLENFKVNLII